MTSKELRELMGAADELCGRLYARRNDPDLKDACVNWADFGCDGAIWCRNESDFEWPMVQISEASPDNGKLVLLMVKELEALGYRNVEVKLEW